MAIPHAKQVFEMLYQDVDGYAISKSARKNRSSWYYGHTYGEVTYHGFLRMLVHAKPNTGEIFYDLGSGTGKAVILAKLLTDFSKVIGVEILKELHEASQVVLSRHQRISSENKSDASGIHFVHADFKTIDFSDADVIFVNATCMHYELGIPLVSKLEKLKKGSRIITNTLPISSEQYFISSIGGVPFSWGEEEVFIHVKK